MVQKLNARSTAGPPRARRRHHARRLEILNAAARAFRQRGFAATGMREIAAVADLSPGNLYHYFKGKQELLYFCQETSLERMLGALDAAREAGGPAADRLRSVIEAHLLCVLDELQGAAAHLELAELPPPLRRKIVARRDRYEKGIRGVVADGVESGEFAACDPKLITHAILGALNWTARWFRPDGARSAAEVAEEYSAYLVRGLLARPARRGRTKRNGGPK